MDVAYISPELGGGKGEAFMEQFDQNQFRAGNAKYAKAAKKMEGHICTVRESIMGGNWNQEFK